MTERCGRLYRGDYRCGLFAGHDGPCGPWPMRESATSLNAEAGAVETAVLHAMRESGLELERLYELVRQVAMEPATSDPARVQSDEPAQGERLRDANSSSLVLSSSSLRTLVEQKIVEWRKTAKDYAFYGQAFHHRADAMSKCADELAALLSPVEGRQQCDCGELFDGVCASCAVADWQAAHPDCPQCCLKPDDLDAAMRAAVEGRQGDEHEDLSRKG